MPNFVGWNIKELKDGVLRERLKVYSDCLAFKVVGQRIVAFLETVAIFQNGKQIRTCSRMWANQHSLFAEYNKVYFPSVGYELIEWNVETFEEKVLMHEVYAMSGVPSDRNFLAVSWDGLLQTSQAKKNLKEVFPKMNKFNWTALLSTNHHAVVAGCSETSIQSGDNLPRWHNVFLLVHLTCLEVANKHGPIAVEWIGDSSSVI